MNAYNDGTLNIREFQHYLYCPHRWGLLSIDRAWAENLFVTKANLMHKTVHNFGEKKSKGLKIIRSLPVYSDEYNIYGVLDYAEIDEDVFRNVEYKPTEVNGHSLHADMMQLYIQKLCIESSFLNKFKIESYFFYNDIRRRIPIRFDNNWQEEFELVRNEMLDFKNNGVIPPIKRGQYCSGCSMKDICLPKTAVKSLSLRINDSLSE